MFQMYDAVGFGIGLISAPDSAFGSCEAQAATLNQILVACNASIPWKVGCDDQLGFTDVLVNDNGADSTSTCSQMAAAISVAIMSFRGPDGDQANIGCLGAVLRVENTEGPAIVASLNNVVDTFAAGSFQNCEIATPSTTDTTTRTMTGTTTPTTDTITPTTTDTTTPTTTAVTTPTTTGSSSPTTTLTAGVGANITENATIPIIGTATSSIIRSGTTIPPTVTTITNTGTSSNTRAMMSTRKKVDQVYILFGDTVANTYASRKAEFIAKVQSEVMLTYKRLGTVSNDNSTNSNDDVNEFGPLKFRNIVSVTLITLTDAPNQLQSFTSRWDNRSVVAVLQIASRTDVEIVRLVEALQRDPISVELPAATGVAGVEAKSWWAWSPLIESTAAIQSLASMTAGRISLDSSDTTTMQPTEKEVLASNKSNALLIMAIALAVILCCWVCAMVVLLVLRRARGAKKDDTHFETTLKKLQSSGSLHYYPKSALQTTNELSSAVTQRRPKANTMNISRTQSNRDSRSFENSQYAGTLTPNLKTRLTSDNSAYSSAEHAKVTQMAAERAAVVAPAATSDAEAKVQPQLLTETEISSNDRRPSLGLTDAAKYAGVMSHVIVSSGSLKERGDEMQTSPTKVLSEEDRRHLFRVFEQLNAGGDDTVLTRDEFVRGALAYPELRDIVIKSGNSATFLKPDGSIDAEAIWAHLDTVNAGHINVLSFLRGFGRLLAWGGDGNDGLLSNRNQRDADHSFEVNFKEEYLVLDGQDPAAGTTSDRWSDVVPPPGRERIQQLPKTDAYKSFQNQQSFRMPMRSSSQTRMNPLMTEANDNSKDEYIHL